MKREDIEEVLYSSLEAHMYGAAKLLSQLATREEIVTAAKQMGFVPQSDEFGWDWVSIGGDEPSLYIASINPFHVANKRGDAHIHQVAIQDNNDGTFETFIS